MCASPPASGPPSSRTTARIPPPCSTPLTWTCVPARPCPGPSRASSERDPLEAHIPEDRLRVLDLEFVSQTLRDLLPARTLHRHLRGEQPQAVGDLTLRRPLLGGGLRGHPSRCDGLSLGVEKRLASVLEQMQQLVGSVRNRLCFFDQVTRKGRDRAAI